MPSPTNPGPRHPRRAVRPGGPTWSVATRADTRGRRRSVFPQRPRPAAPPHGTGRGPRRTAGLHAPDPDGWTRVTIPIESAERALPELLKLGAEVLAPVELRERITQTLDTLIDLHRRPA
ncbi:WYL domain-containing protein [Streptosporangium sp. NPDC020145]|uniref:WYL domain-containing protein n=1 Tax=Streptosporangium sp. NPDC020145 TaxID=3154694 RepID=UPI00342316A6